VAFRLLALDLDGTLLRSDKRISARSRRALLAARAQGVRVVFVTGRPHPSACRVLGDLAGKFLLVLHNGALVIEAKRVLRCLPLATEAARRAVAAGRREGATAVAHCGLRGEGRLLVEPGPHGHDRLTYYLERAGQAVRTVPHLETALEQDGEVLQVMFAGTQAAMEQLRNALAAQLGDAVGVERTVYPAHDLELVDVLSPGVGKDEAVAWLQGRWALTGSETLAIGDNWNDRGMLRSAGLGLVMGNAAPALLELGLPVLPPNDEDGVALAIEEHILRR